MPWLQWHLVASRLRYSDQRWTSGGDWCLPLLFEGSYMQRSLCTIILASALHVVIVHALTRRV